MSRRSLLAAAALAVPAAAQEAGAGVTPVRLGIDLYSIRSQGWDAFQYLDYCAKWKAKVVHFSEIRFLGGLEPEHLRKVRVHADELGIQLEVGMRSICPSSKAFDTAAGTAEQQITRMIETARITGSPIVRSFVGTSADRGPDGMKQHIEDAVKVLRSVRSRVVDAGLKIAIENHSGDMQARELKSLIEAAGPDFVGACIDSGNPCWTIEDPHFTLETLAPYVLTSHVRDSAVWNVPSGAAVSWVRMGEGNVDIDSYVRKYEQKCPGRALSLEVIVTDPRVFPYRDPKFWEMFPQTPAWEFARFETIAARGNPVPPRPKLSKEAAVQREREDLEVSLRYAHKLLNL